MVLKLGVLALPLLLMWVKSVRMYAGCDKKKGQIETVCGRRIPLPASI
jgi:hypothetical protein